MSAEGMQEEVLDGLVWAISNRSAPISGTWRSQDLQRHCLPRVLFHQTRRCTLRVLTWVHPALMRLRTRFHAARLRARKRRSLDWQDVPRGHNTGDGHAAQH